MKHSILFILLIVFNPVALIANEALPSDYKFIENGKAIKINQCGKFFGKIAETQNTLIYKRGVSSCALIGGRHLNGGSYRITAELKQDCSARMFVGGSYVKGFMVNYGNFIQFHEGLISSKGSFKFKSFEISGDVTLEITSDRREAQLLVNGKKIATSNDPDVLKGGYFGITPVGKEEVKLVNFKLQATSSADTLPQAYRPMNRLHQSYWTEVYENTSKAEPCDVLFLGDSITDAFDGTCSFTKDPKRLGTASWERLSKDRIIVNAGIGSDRTQHLLWRVKKMPLEVMKPKNIVLLIGINNLGSGHHPDDVAEGIRQIVHELEKRSPESQIIVHGIFPLRRTKDVTTNKNRLIVNQKLAEMKWGKNVELMNLDTVMLDDKGLLKDGYSYDGCHLSETGFRVWEEAISKELN